jgi:hypothetical protein
MKTVIEYSDSADDHMALMRALKSTNMACLLFEIKINMKKRCISTLDADSATAAEYGLLDSVWERINEEFDSHGICIDDLIN